MSAASRFDLILDELAAQIRLGNQRQALEYVERLREIMRKLEEEKERDASL